MNYRRTTIFIFLGNSGGENVYLALKGDNLELAVEKGRIKTPLGDLPFIRIGSR